MSLSTKSVRSALGEVRDHALGRSLKELDSVKNVKVKRGSVEVDLVLPRPLFADTESLRQACNQALVRLEGVEQVSVNLQAAVRGAPTDNRRVLPNVKNVLAVASGKGGVAKSTTAANLAIALSQAGASVGLLDADIYGPSMPTMLDVEQEPSMGAGQRINPAIAHGIQMISIGFFVPEGRAAVLRGPMVSGYINQFLANVAWGELDYLVIDYPPGTGDIQLTLSQQAPITGAVICTTPQEISLVDVRKAVAMLDTTRVPVLGVIETMSYFVCENCSQRHDIFRHGGGKRIAKALGVPLLGEVPIDPRVAAGGDQGRPIVQSHPEIAAARAYREIAEQTANQLALLNIERGSYLESFSLKWDRS